MKPLLKLAFILSCVGAASSQSVTTPNIQLNTPYPNDPQWNFKLNANFLKLDLYLSGNQAVSSFTFKTQTSTTNPPAGQVRLYMNVDGFLHVRDASGNDYTFNGGGGGGGAVGSVFGRTGTITAQAGDYSVSLITGAAPLASPSFTGTVSIGSLADGCLQISSHTVISTGLACGSGGGGGANNALSNLTVGATSLNTSLFAQAGVDLGSIANPIRNIIMYGSGTYGSTYFTLGGTPTGARIITLPDFSDTLLGATSPQTITNKVINGSQINGATSIPASTLPLGTNSVPGALRCDGTTTTCAGGVVSSTGGGGGSPLTAKGQIYGFSTAAGAIPAGTTNGNVLTVDTTNPFGLSYQPVTGTSFQGSGLFSALPATCTPGVGIYQYFATDQPIGIRQHNTCTSTNTFTQDFALTGGNLIFSGNALQTNPATQDTIASATSLTGRKTMTGGFNSGNETLSWASSMTFSAILGTTNVTLLGNMSFTIPNGTAEGDQKALAFIDTPGGSVVTAPANVLGFTTPGLSAGGTKTIPMVWNAAATKWIVTSSGSGGTTTIVHQIVGSFNGSGAALSAGQSVYMVSPFSCAIQNWTILVDSGTATVDVWKITSTSALPTVANTITASANPAIASGVKLTSSTLTGWTTAVTAGDTLAVNLKTLSGPTLLNFSMSCQ